MSAFDDMAERWLEFLSANMGRSDATVIKYRGYLIRLNDFLVTKGQDHLSCTQESLDEFTGMHLIKQGLRAPGRRPVICAVKGFFAWMIRCNARQDNPALNLLTPKVPTNLPDVMQLRDAEKLLSQPDLNTFLGVRDAAIIACFIGCGFRLSGVTGLNESSLIFTHDEHGHEILIIKVEEKGKKQRMVPAPDELRLLIRAYLGHPQLQEIVRELDDGDKVLFVSTQHYVVPDYLYFGEKRRISQKSVDDLLKKYGKRAGIDPKYLHAHSMRHLYGTELVEADVNVLHMKALMGHAKTDTLDIYNHTALRKLKNEAFKANPLGKMITPVTQLLKELNK